MTIVDRIKEKGQIYNMTIASIERAVNISNGTIARWNERIPSADNLYKVASLLHVSMEYLLTGEGKNDNSSVSNQELLNLYKQLPEQGKFECIGFVKGYLAAQQNKDR